jgi:hypothetical protein
MPLIAPMRLPRSKASISCFVGPADLSLSYGVPMQFQHRLIQQAKDRVANAVAKTGKLWGIVTVTPEGAQAELDRGGRMVTCVDDHFARSCAQLRIHGPSGCRYSLAGRDRRAHLQPLRVSRPSGAQSCSHDSTRHHLRRRIPRD